MRCVIQRVSEAYVTVDGQETGRIEKGLCAIIGVEKGDTEKDALYMAGKIAKLRIFEDENEKMNLYEKCCAELRKMNVPVENGIFRTHMMVHLINDGPVTILLDSKKTF